MEGANSMEPHEEKEPNAEHMASTAEEGGLGDFLDEVRSRVVPSEMERWIELISALLLSAAVVGSAFSAWQAALWNGRQATRYAEASAIRLESNRELAIAIGQIGYDAGSFADAAIAYVEGQEEALPLFEELLFRDEFRVFVNEWLELDPLNNPDAPQTPFDLPDYANSSLTESTLLLDRAEQKFEEGKEANKNSDNYVLSTVFFASVLFFGGISTKFRGIRVRWGTLAFATIGLAVATAFLATLPRLPI